LLTTWVANKSIRLATLLGSFLAVSIAVNATIILADGSRF
jgi:hypothetical protein